jgi:hypothetical protein
MWPRRARRRGMRAVPGGSTRPLDCMPNKMRCPKCEYGISVLEIGHTRSCPQCGVAIRVVGWGSVTAANVGMMLVFGFLAGGAIAEGGALGWSLAIAILGAWWWIEVATMRALLKVALAEAPEA